MIDRIDLTGQQLPVFLCQTKMRLCQVSGDGNDEIAVLLLPALILLHIVNDSIQRFLRCSGTGMAVDFYTLRSTLLDKCADKVSPQKAGGTGEKNGFAFLRGVGVVSLRSDFLRQDTFCTQVGSEVLFTAS